MNGAAESGRDRDAKYDAVTATNLRGIVSQETLNNHAAFVWSVAELLRGDYRQSDYQKVVLPLVVLRRFDCVLEPTKDLVLARYVELKGRVENRASVLAAATVAKETHGTSPLTTRGQSAVWLGPRL